ncbi:MAG TPA: YqaA family protein [Geminicoccus sp.]|jgi:membrane protein YqaA with SNARE-associated domain|uniref:YqaA family protein n=1 Tax=Geminicoccus sp. TaxID=2024832 RepID=UPI002E3345A5|nr:YqaA family protein [Geminicoccus sp.]HEX2528765.1 YqaA family protein [Geminicoccus sp.]
MNDLLLLFGLFASAFSSATILPGSSEVVMLGLMTQGLSVLSLWVVATIGNLAGSVLSWWMGTALLRFQDRRWFPVGPDKLERAQHWFARWGKPALLLTWLPGVGDALSIAAGTLRVHLATFVLLVGFAKGARYALVLGGADWLGVDQIFN